MHIELNKSIGTLIKHIDKVTTAAPSNWYSAEEMKARRYQAEIAERKIILLRYIHTLQTMPEGDRNRILPGEMQTRLQTALDYLALIEKIEMNFHKFETRIPDRYAYWGSGEAQPFASEADAMAAAAAHLGKPVDVLNATHHLALESSAVPGARAPKTTGEFISRHVPADIVTGPLPTDIIRGSIVQTQTEHSFVTKHMYSDNAAVEKLSRTKTGLPNQALLEEAQKIFLTHMTKKNPFNDPSKPLRLSHPELAPRQLVEAIILVAFKEGVQVVPDHKIIKDIYQDLNKHPKKRGLVERALVQDASTEFDREAIRTASGHTITQETEKKPRSPGRSRT